MNSCYYNSLDELLNSNFLTSGERPIPKSQYQDKTGRLLSDNELNTLNKVIFCHDMKGGYLDDDEAKGNENIFAYRFYYWDLIDVFIYFSHHFVTVPPSNWIKLCRMHGVKCLGTLIIEGGSRESELIKMFNADNFEIAATKITDIKNYFQFDGWLINFECKVEKILVDQILSFLDRLKALGNDLVWYDSIIEDGSLSYQNCLNNNNILFYKCVGNIFMNYGWNNDLLRESLKCCHGNCNTVYVGVDCFGRGCPGGGGFGCNQGLQMVEDAVDMQDKVQSNFSIALFAPGWCYETNEKKSIELNDDSQIYYTDKFFRSMHKYLRPTANILDGKEIIYRTLPDRNLDQLEFATNFSLGQGKGTYQSGIKVSTAPYNYLGDQQILPNFFCYCCDQSRSNEKEMINNSEVQSLQMLPCCDVAFNGTGSFQLKINRPPTNEVIIELWRMNCTVSNDRTLRLQFVLGLLTELNEFLSTKPHIDLTICHLLKASVHQSTEQPRSRFERSEKLDYFNFPFEEADCTNIKKETESDAVQWYKFDWHKRVQGAPISVRIIQLKFENIQHWKKEMGPIYFGDFKLCSEN